jgi:hypothetical protein
MAKENSTLSASDAKDLQDDIRKIREALLIGLESFGEVERVIDAHHLHGSHSTALAAGLLPLHPTGASNTIGVFANALRLLENMEPEYV